MDLGPLPADSAAALAAARRELQAAHAARIAAEEAGHFES